MKRSNRVVGYCHVVCDILHEGHIRFFEFCKDKCDVLICGVLTDEAAGEKGKKPIMGFEERFEVLKALKYFKLVIPQFTWSPLDSVEMICPDILFESETQTDQPANDWMEMNGGKVIQAPYYKHQSSSKIKDKIKKTWRS